MVENSIDIAEIMSRVNMSATELADLLHISYHDMAMMLAHKKDIPDSVIGRLYRLFGKSIFFT